MRFIKKDQQTPLKPEEILNVEMDEFLPYSMDTNE